MLYPKNSRPLTAEDFMFPTSEYRAAPFWAWNTKLDRDELVRQIGVFKEMGYGGFHMHVRIGLATEYLGDEFMDIAAACVEKARQEKMLTWLYDEDRWPSGAAGGLVTKNEDYRIRHLLLTRRPYGTPASSARERWSRASFRRTENGRLLACFDVILNKEGNLISYNMINENDTPHGFKLYAYAETALSSPWYNNQTYVDILNPEAIGEFIRVTHERYAQRFQKDFGIIVPAIFTDEPQFSQGCLQYPLEDKDVTLPWTGDLPETYGKAYGEDLIARLPELLWDLPEGKASVIRYHFHDHVTNRFVSAFFDQCGRWCAAYNILFTGHMMDEPTLEGQTHAVGEVMRAYRAFGLPGIDMLGDGRQFTTAKQAQSVARQNGCPGVLSELYGVTNWDFDFRGHKLQGDWQAAMGVSVRVPHLSWASMNGQAKRDYPGTFNYQAPWYREYPYVENHFARLASVLTRGMAICAVAVIHPIESYWLHWGPTESTEAVRTAMDEKFLALCDWLLRGFIDFDYICESTLPDLCGLSGVGARFPVGKMSYDAVIIPGMETIRSSTMERLEKFRDRGGRLIFLGSPPVYVDAIPNDGPRKLWEQSEHIEFDRLAVLNSLEEFRDLRMRDSSGSFPHGFLYQLREEPVDGGSAGGPPVRWLFVCHADRAANKDNPRSDNYRIEIRGEWQAVEYNTINGTTDNPETEISGGWTTLHARLWDHDSLLVKLIPTKKAVQAKPVVESETMTAAMLYKAALSTTRFTGPVPVTLHEPNVLLLDIAEFALNDGNWRGREEILRLDTILRWELEWPLRGDSAAQPWAEHDDSTPHALRLRYTFESELPIAGTELALENAAVTKVTLNGEAVGPVQGWYVDKCMEKIKLPDIKAGTNTLELILPYGKKTDVEACYLLGDFSVKVQGTLSTLGAPVRSLAFGDITRQGLPFYGGSLVYHLEAECRPPAGSAAGSITIEASSYRFMLLRVAVDGIDRGVIAYSPYRLTVDSLSAGMHRIDLTGFGCRINTFGQLHNNQGHDGFWWGPGSWRTMGDAWSYEYNFWAQGVLKSPEIYS